MRENWKSGHSNHVTCDAYLQHKPDGLHAFETSIKTITWMNKIDDLLNLPSLQNIAILIDTNSNDFNNVHGHHLVDNDVQSLF